LPKLEGPGSGQGPLAETPFGTEYWVQIDIRNARARSPLPVEVGMGLEEQTVLDRFYSVLVREVRSRHPADARVPLLVADIKHNLVPYEVRRGELGVATVGDYDRALLRLLDGEGGYLRLGSEEFRRKLRDILGSPDLETGVLSDFMAADVHFNPRARHTSRVDDSLQMTDSCPSCREALPQRNGLKYCPFCGDDARRRPCGQCGEPLRLVWKFCIRCGNGTEPQRSH
jgi:hypothetical protein